ncbi:MAG: acetyl-CoA carboxylase, biotin carboxyl carrier protein [Phycisphaerae bacterium]|nr:acetyl-CoA carboxylase, biotin carboxyl carrier protein [Phycisphaerae bacterium]
MDIRKLKELVRLMVANDLSEIDLRDSEEQVTIHRPSPYATPQVTHQPAPPAAAPVAAAPPSEAAAPSASVPSPQPATEPAADDTAGLVPVQSPMVGTFYAASSPDVDDFVKVGSSIAAGDVVCLVEAMKIFNEIKAESGGTVQKILVNNGDSVEFGQDLFLVKPS